MTDTTTTTSPVTAVLYIPVSNETQKAELENLIKQEVQTWQTDQAYDIDPAVALLSHALLGKGVTAFMSKIVLLILALFLYQEPINTIKFIGLFILVVLSCILILSTYWYHRYCLRNPAYRHKGFVANIVGQLLLDAVIFTILIGGHSDVYYNGIAITACIVYECFVEYSLYSDCKNKLHLIPMITTTSSTPNIIV
jgi:hypothetical protein